MTTRHNDVAVTEGGGMGLGLRRKMGASLWLLLLTALLPTMPLQAEEIQEFVDTPLEEPLVHPDWFKLSFLDIYDDIDEAVAAGKKGVILYFSQKDCPYCKAHMENNWGNPDIVKYTQQYFDVIAIDVKGSRTLTDIDERVYDEKGFSAMHKTNFTPSMIFYTADKKIALKVQGYHTPYKFRAALEYVADGHYKQEKFRDFLARGEQAEQYGQEELNHHPAFMPPPYLLDRSRIKASRPLAVFFEQQKCYACDVLHAGPLSNDDVTAQLKKMDVVQLDADSDMKLITPDGRRTTAKEWAKDLDLYYSPTLVFFDDSGKEIIRINSVVWLYRLSSVLNYVNSGGYKEYSTYQLWRQGQARKHTAIQ